MSSWTPYTIEYKPLAAGSIDGTDTEPHDRAIVRAINANFVPCDTSLKADYTLFVGRLPHKVDEDKLREKFSRFGRVESVCIVHDIVTGQSKGYGFVEFSRKSDANEAWRESRELEIEGYRLIVDKEAGHSLKGWVPRRLGGGWGGRKEAGQLRFGCVERPWRRPIILPQQSSGHSAGGSIDGSAKFLERDRGRERFKHDGGSSRQYLLADRHSRKKDHYSEKEYYSSRQDRKEYHNKHEQKSYHRSRSDGKERDYSGRSTTNDEDHRRNEKEQYFSRLDRREIIIEKRKSYTELK